jgi:hypothetical protein
MTQVYGRHRVSYDAPGVARAALFWRVLARGSIYFAVPLAIHSLQAAYTKYGILG